MKQRLLNLLLVTFVAALVGCAEDGINESALTIDGDNKNTVAEFVGIGAEKSIEDGAAPGRELVTRALNAVKSSQRGLSRNSATVDLSADSCPDGGTAIYEVDSNQSGTSGTVTIVYSNCAYSYGGYSTVTNGTAEFSFDEDGSFTMVYDITTVADGETYTISGTYVCDDSFNCYYETEFSSDGVNYRISNVEVSGNSTSGWNVSATIYHEELGYVEITGTNLVECDNGGFSSGTVTVVDSTNATVMTIDYVSCTEMTVTFNNVAETVAQ